MSIKANLDLKFICKMINYLLKCSLAKNENNVLKTCFNLNNVKIKLELVKGLPTEDIMDVFFFLKEKNMNQKTCL